VDRQAMMDAIWRAKHLQGLTWAEAGAEFDKSGEAARCLLKDAENRGEWSPPNESPPNDPGVTVNRSDDGSVTVVSTGPEIRTEADMRELAALSEERWECVDFRVNSWPTTARESGQWFRYDNVHTTGRFKPNQAVIDAEAVIADLVADMRQYSPSYSPIRYVRPGEAERHMLELFVADHHIGLLAWNEETGEDYDSDLAENILRYALGRMMERASGFPVDKVLLPLGNDWMHTDATDNGKGGQTTAGTPQDVDTRYQKMFRRARRMAVMLIDEVRQLAPVEVVVVPGNHDTERMFFLGDALHGWYRLDESVTIRNSAAKNQYVRYGNTLIGLTHGHEQKDKDLPLTMATEAAEDWAATEWREWHTGHLHKKRETQYVPVVEDQGVRVRVMPSLVARDAWHASKGYRHKRACEAYLWHHSEGYAGTFSVGVPPDMRRG